MQFFDLYNQYQAIEKEFSNQLAAIHLKSEYILGSHVRNFEEAFANYCHVRYAVGVNSGTDALFLSLKLLGIGKNDEVIVPPFTFVATSFAVLMTGARPVFVDIDKDTYTIDPKKIERVITKRTKAIIPVHLFGLCAAMPEINAIARRHKVFVIEDAAQAHGAAIQGRPAGSFGHTGCFSFYPTKNLSAFGDAGLITTNSKKLYRGLLQLRDCGRGKMRYLHPVVGYNSRLDSIQALALSLKLKKIDTWNSQRIKNAALYLKLLSSVCAVTRPFVPDTYTHVFHAYSIRTKKRQTLIKEFSNQGIPVSIFYAVPAHLQKSHKFLNYKRGDFPVSEKVSREILSLPIHPSLCGTDIKNVCSIIRKVHNG